MTIRIGAQAHPLGGIRIGSQVYAALGPVPNITDVTNPIVSGTGFTITGTNFGAAQLDGFSRLVQDAVTVELTESAWSAVSITCASVNVFATLLGFGPATVRVENDDGNVGTFAAVLAPPAEYSWCTLLAINTTAEYRIEADGSPDLQVGEQIALSNILYEDSGCTVATAHVVTLDTLYDGSFVVANTAPNDTFYVRAWRKRADTGAWETAVQEVEIARESTGAGAGTEASDSAGGAGTVRVAGTSAATEASDSSTGVGRVAITGGGSATEAQSDSASGTGSAAVRGSGSATESGDDTAAGAASLSVTGVGSASESGDDTAIGFGTVDAPDAPDDTQPLQFIIEPRIGVAVGSFVEFAPFPIQGTNQPAPIVIPDGGVYRLNDEGEWISAAGFANPGDMVYLGHDAADGYQATRQTSINIGGVSAVAISITVAAPAIKGTVLIRATQGVSAVATTDNKLQLSITNADALLRTAERR